jgi:ferredoxin--NADP+ reductase
LVDDFNAGRLTDPVGRQSAFERQLRDRTQVVDNVGWRAIDAAETSAGSASGRPRLKFTAVPDMLAAAASVRPQAGKRLLAGLRR